MLLNPLAIIVETFKWGLFGVGDLLSRRSSLVTTAAVFVAVCVRG